VYGAKVELLLLLGIVAFMTPTSLEELELEDRLLGVTDARSILVQCHCQGCTIHDNDQSQVSLAVFIKI
jgi:hypothetical protein